MASEQLWISSQEHEVYRQPFPNHYLRLTVDDIDEEGLNCNVQLIHLLAISETIQSFSQ